ncbi:MAG: hypothetical protein K2Q18_00170, partial [Bdellovibrionales bacterium]|nr:hypothetical protein [Bdellovibrionales bacterium]
FGRKSFATSEERPNVDTYSSLFGRVGACALVGSQAVISSYLSLKNIDANQFILMWGNGFLLTMLLILSAFYIKTDDPKFAKLYRMFSSLYIILFFLILIFAHIIP